MSDEWVALCPHCGTLMYTRESAARLFADFAYQCPDDCEITPEEYKEAFNCQCEQIELHQGWFEPQEGVS